MIIDKEINLFYWGLIIQKEYKSYRFYTNNVNDSMTRNENLVDAFKPAASASAKNWDSGIFNNYKYLAFEVIDFTMNSERYLRLHVGLKCPDLAIKGNFAFHHLMFFHK